MVFSQDGIFSRAEQAVDKHGEAKARETLELALGEAQMQKYEQGLTDEQLTEKINAIGEELPKEKPEHPELQNVIVDGHIFEIDRSVPKIVDYIGPANGVIITASVSGNNGWFKQGDTVNVTVTGRIKTYSGGTITTVSATKDGTAITGFSIDNDGKYTIDNITADTTIVIKAKDSNNKENTKTIPIMIRIDNIAPTLSEVTATAEANRIKIKAIATDNESGLKHINYSVSPTTVNSVTGKLTSGQEITLTATENNEYTITFTAKDNAGNISEVQTKTVETLGVIKHIKTPEGLKEVNTVDIYGADVIGYDCTRIDAEWQLFYIDEEDDHRVYLIAKDYMAPPVKQATPGLYKDRFSQLYPKAYVFGKSETDMSILENFKTNIPITSFTNKFLKEYAGIDATYNSLQAVNYMLNQEIWKEYINNKKADYAFGGATLPLMTASYNDICKQVDKIYYQKIEDGYKIKKDNEDWGLGVNVDETHLKQKMYCTDKNYDAALVSYLASPVSGLKGRLFACSRADRVETNAFFDLTQNFVCAAGVRPIISLKTNAQFTDNGDGTYTIN